MTPVKKREPPAERTGDDDAQVSAYGRAPISASARGRRVHSCDGHRGTIRSALGTDRFRVTDEGDRQIVWPTDWTDESLPPWRDGAGRSHADVPLPELASLA